MKKSINQSTITFILNGISIISLIFMVFSLSSYNKINNQLNRAQTGRFELTYNANRFMNGSAYLTNEVRAFASTGIQEHYDNYWNEVNNLKNRDIGVKKMQEIGITKEEQDLINNMSSISNELVPLEEDAMEQAMAGQKQQAINYVYGTTYNEAITKISSLKEQFLDMLDTRTSSKVTTLTNEAGYVKNKMIVSLAIVIIMQLLVSIYTKIKIINPVRIVRDQMCEISKGSLSANFALKPDTSEIGMLADSIHSTKKELKKYIHDIDIKLADMANGNMDFEVGSDYLGEFMPIQDAMRKILDSLNIALSHINSTAYKVSIESERTAAGSKTLSDGAVQQAAAVQELSSNIQELSRQVDSTTHDAEDARKCSADANIQLSECSQKMEELSAAMENISNASHEIGGIIKTIEDISFQTNILALNAAVEAARAGEAGKGFAVVAGEVQNLANKSSVAANNISELIENSMVIVEHGTGLTASTKEALAKVVSGTEISAGTVNSIAESAIQQSIALKQITIGMDQISSVVQTTASTAEELAETARELYGHSEGLKTAVQKFHLRNTGSYNNTYTNTNTANTGSNISLADNSSNNNLLLIGNSQKYN